jgi:hypothetical protein
MKTLLILALITALLLWYALQGRDWLKSKSWAMPFFEWIEPIEILAFKKSQTILAARTLSGLGVALTTLQQFNGIDITPILPFIPEEYRTIVTAAVGCLPLIISAIGWMMERLRYTSTKPIELVAVPDKVVAESPVLREAVAMADATKVEAVAVVAAKVEEAKAA